MKIPTTFTIVDVETTGMRSANDRVIDIGIIRVEHGKITKTFSSFINPGMPISARITEINGIKNEDVATAPSFDDVALDILSLFKDAVFVAHNAGFDYSFIKSEFRRCGIDFEAPVLCSVKLSRSLYAGERGHSLDALIDRFGLTCDLRHRAFPDAHVIYQFLGRVRGDFPRKRVDEVIWHLLYGVHAPELIDRKALALLPDTSGVYFFYDKDRTLLYVGKSKHIRTRVRSHFSDTLSRREVRLCKETASVESQETPGELSALLLESSLVKIHMPEYNRVLRKRKQLVIARKRQTPAGYFTVELEHVADIEESANIVGIFRSLSQAKQKIRDLSKEHCLCQKILGLEKGASCFGYQIMLCKGACLSRENIDDYNTRFEQAFKRRKVKTWPFAGPIMIEEKGTKEGTGAVFVVDDWRLTSSHIYDNGDHQEFLNPSGGFDYDIYKILASYISNSANKRNIKQIGKGELKSFLAEAHHEYETVIV